MGLGMLGLYFLLKEEENLPLLLEQLRGLGDVALLLQEETGEREKVGFRCQNRLRRLFPKENTEEMLENLLCLLEAETPSGELCKALGEAFFQQEKWRQAIFWYENALRLEVGALPCRRLRLCYEALGAWEQAETYRKMCLLWQKESRRNQN